MQARQRQRLFKEFSAWCDGRSLTSAPAHPWTVSVFVRFLERRADVDEIPLYVEAIDLHHELKRMTPPGRYELVQRTVDGTTQRAEAAAAVSEHSSDLFVEDDFLVEEAPIAPAAKAKAPAKAPAKRRLSHKPKLVARRPS